MMFANECADCRRDPRRRAGPALRRARQEPSPRARAVPSSSARWRSCNSCRCHGLHRLPGRRAGLRTSGCPGPRRSRFPGGGDGRHLHRPRCRAAERVLVVACDLPFLDAGLLGRLVESSRRHDGAWVRTPSRRRAAPRLLSAQSARETIRGEIDAGRLQGRRPRLRAATSAEVVPRTSSASARGPPARQPQHARRLRTVQRLKGESLVAPLSLATFRTLYNDSSMILPFMRRSIAPATRARRRRSACPLGRSTRDRHRDAAQARARRSGRAGRLRAGATAAQGAARHRAGTGGRRSGRSTAWRASRPRRTAT